jgi:hypothetical protein
VTVTPLIYNVLINQKEQDMEMKIYPPTDWSPNWTVTGNAIGYAGCQDNHEVEDLVRLTAPVDAQWDSEGGQFFAYLNTESEAMLLVEHMEKVLKK